MNLKIAICDDASQEISALEAHVRNWAGQRRHVLQIDGFSSAEAFLFRYEEDKSFDLLLLDVEMGGMSGVELARRIRPGNREVQILFITGYMDYIADGYDVEALHYLIKPVSADKLFPVLDRAVERLGRNERALLLDQSGEMTRIPLYEVQYLEVNRNYVTVHAALEYTVKTPLRELERALDDRFLRVGRSFIVNLNCARRVTRETLFLASGAEIPLPRGQYEKLNRAIIERL